MKLTDTPAWKALRVDAERLRNDPWLPDRAWWLVERPFWALAVYRLGNALTEALPPRVGRPVNTFLYLFASPFIQVVTNIEIPFGAVIGPGLRIHHGSGIVIHGKAVIGANCTIRQGCTVGVIVGKGAPHIGDNVGMGSNSQILGPVTVGDGAKVGAQALVLHDVPAGASVGGVPARVLASQS